MQKNFAWLKQTVISQQLCARCGICAGVCPANAIEFDQQNFPRLSGRCRSCGFCGECCPGADVNLPSLAQELSGKEETRSPLGHIESAYVAHAADSQTRQAGTSGGLITALMLFLLSVGQIDGAIVVEADPDQQHLTRGVLATSSAAIRNAAQSKYCVTPSMAALRDIRTRKGRFAVAALPCQVHGLRKLAHVDPELFGKIAVIFGLCCSCTMSEAAWQEALRAAGIRRENVARFEFRGGGWPGGMFVRKKDGIGVPLHPREAYGTVVNVMFRLFGPERCRLCVDGTSELADISFGDFWAFDYADAFSKLERCTQVFQRTAKGRNILREAELAGAIVLHPLPVEKISARTVAMVRGKRSRAAIQMAKRRQRGLPNPDYHAAMKEPGLNDRLKYFPVELFDLLRKNSTLRSGILKILFSPLITPLHKLRMRFLVRHHNE
ncbi:MAG: Coenzyme F420 hydrogenase/dehydrogenase, beta subunit C-terminal domain [Candidatus Electronema sp. V4]|uniref:Coenzyme F420 hydrogenase/dehydrogenase, beta subunit C-terminal domain n=1 Tax=Candidatus Electronema sp. V4 TaxID=3454756 RepID=UPI00405552CA